MRHLNLSIILISLSIPALANQDEYDPCNEITSNQQILEYSYYKKEKADKTLNNQYQNLYIESKANTYLIKSLDMNIPKR